MTDGTRADPTFALVERTTESTQDLLRDVLQPASRTGLDCPTPGFPNPPGWLAWHICRGIDRNVSEMQGVEQLWLGDGHAGAFGRPPDRADTGFEHERDDVRSFSSPESDDFVRYADAVFARLRGFLASLCDDDLDHTTESATLQNRRTVRQRLTALCTEMLQHRGELAVTAAYADAQTIFPVPSDAGDRTVALRRAAAGAAWPDETIDRLARLRVDPLQFARWSADGWPTPEMVDKSLDLMERIHQSPATVRQATKYDVEAVVDLCRNAPETVGELTVVVDRSPNPFAQFVLQENSFIQLFEERGVAHGMRAASIRNTFVGGERTTAYLPSGWRIRTEARGRGLSGILQLAPGPATSWFGLTTYWYVRDGNSARGWISRIQDGIDEPSEQTTITSDVTTATVGHLTDRSDGVRSERVRPATDDDLAVCADLVNRCGDGLDLFRPLDQDRLCDRLANPAWGTHPDFVPDVYGMGDFYVLERAGRITACAGLWDRGRDIREHWSLPDGQSRTVDPTAILDFGHADGAEDDAVELLRHLLALSFERDRSGMMVALDVVSDLAGAMDACGVRRRNERREVHSLTYGTDGGLSITRPYTDLRYW